MNNDLFFLPILRQALESGDRSQIRAALEQIEAKGSLPQFKRGLDQFRQFVKESKSKITISVITNGIHLDPIPIPDSGNPIRLGPILPGTCVIELSSGWLLWEGTLTEEDLLWDLAFPEKDLPVAADSGDNKEIPSRILAMPEESFSAIVIPGLESGWLQITVS